MKIPLHLPYINDMGTYERFDGSIAFNGIHYNYVKRKVQNDTLYILCKLNYAKTKLASEKDNYGKKVNDLPVDKKTPFQTAKKSVFASEYNQHLQQYTFCNSYLPAFHTLQFYKSTLPSPSGFTRIKPPDHIC